ncbi:unnamed protein product [Caenorhabditis brenneri]
MSELQPFLVRCRDGTRVVTTKPLVLGGRNGRQRRSLGDRPNCCQSCRAAQKRMDNQLTFEEYHQELVELAPPQNAVQPDRTVGRLFDLGEEEKWRRKKLTNCIDECDHPSWISGYFF